MCLGENIYHLRTEKGMSQGDLAEALSVSRQSVSKWETGGATPDLDKLVKLSQLFGISLDELVKGTEITQEAPVSPHDAELKIIYVERTEPTVPKRKIVGFALFGLALLVILLCSVLGGMLEGLLFSLPFWVCGMICFLFKERIGLRCSWAVFFLVDVFLHFTTGSSAGSLLGILRGIAMGVRNNPAVFFVSFGMLLCLLFLVVYTLRSFKTEVLEPSASVTRKLIGLVLCLALLHIIPYGVSMLLQPYGVDGQSLYTITRIYQVMGILTQWCRIPVFCKLVRDLLSIWRWRKHHKEKEC